MKRDKGFTLIELLATMLLASLLFVMGGAALRNYWMVRSLQGGADEVQTQLRRQQERAISESNPLVYGARFRVGSGAWSLVQFDPRKTSNKCTEVERRRFDAGVRVQAASFTTVAEITDTCRGIAGASSTDEFVFFYARGSSNAGSLVLEQPSLEQTRTIEVTAVTGRVEAEV